MKEQSKNVVEVLPLSGIEQGKERFKIKLADGQEQILTTWDYATIYSYPYLYSKLYNDLLNYKAVEEIGKLTLKHGQQTQTALHVLDLACGSGLMGKYLKEHSTNIKTLVGVDILQEAIDALNRDYPSVYDNTFTVSETLFDELYQYTFNCLTISGGANHIALSDIQNYINLLESDSYLVFNLLLHGEKREIILSWLNDKMSFIESKVYVHRKLMNGVTVQHEIFVFQKK